MTALRLLLRLTGALFAGLLALGLLGIAWLGLAGVPAAVELAQRMYSGQLQVAEAEGGLFGPILLKDVRFETDSLQLELDRAELDWRPSLLRLQEVRITRLELGTLTLRLKPTPPTEPKPLQPALPFDLSVDRASLARLELHTAEAAPEDAALVVTDSALSFTWRREHLQGAASATHPQSGPLSVVADLRLEPAAVQVESLRVEGPGRALLKGRLGLLDTPSQLTLDAQQLRWPVQGTAQIEVPALQAQVEGLLGKRLDTRVALQGQLRAALPGADADAAPQAFQLDALAQLRETELQLERLLLKGPPGSGSLTAEGRAQWQPALTVEAELQLDELDPGLLLAEFPGRINGTLSARTLPAPGEDELPRVQFSARIADSKLRDYPLSLDARGSVEHRRDQTRLDLAAFDLRSGRTRIRGQGALLPRLDAELNVEAPQLQALLPALAGSATLQARVAGEPVHPAVQAKGQLRALRYEALSLGGAQIDIDYDPARASKAAIDLSELRSGATHLPSAKLRAEGRAEQHRITLETAVAEPSTDLSLRLDGAVDLEARRWQGQLSDSRIRPPYGPAWSQETPAALVIEAERQTLEKLCWSLQGQGRACLAVRHAPPLLALDTELAGVDAAGFAALLPSGWAVETKLDGGGVIELRDGVPSRIDLSLRTGAGRVLAPGTPPLTLEPGTLAVVQDGTLWRAKADLQLDRIRIDGTASLPMQGAALAERPLSGELKLAVPELGWLESFIPGATEIGGRLDGAVRFAGTPAAPQVDGQLTLSGGRVRVESAGLQIRELRAAVRGGLGGALAIEASARSGDGVLTVKGQADPAAKTARIEIDGDTVQVANLPDARVWVSPKLVFEQKPDGLNLTGEVLVPRAEITPRKLGGGIVSASADQVVVGAEVEEKPLPLTASVRVRMGDAVRFEGFGLKSRFGGQITVLESPGGGGTRARGELQLVDAVYKAYGQDLRLETGRILFSGGPIGEPTVDLKAVRQPNEDVTVTLHVRGTLEKPSFDLSSSPAMTQEQQLGWLLLGRPIDSSGEFSAASAALSLGLAGGDKLSQKLTKSLGIDTISLGSEAGEANDQARFTVGKYLSPKLYVSYGVGLFDNGNVLRLLYDLGRGFKLRTETAATQSGGDLLYSRDR